MRIFLAQCCTKILHFLDRNFLTKNNGLKNERNRRNLSSEKELEVLHAGSEGGARHKMQNCSGFRVGWTRGLYTSCILEISRPLKSLVSYTQLLFQKNENSEFVLILKKKSLVLLQQNWIRQGWKVFDTSSRLQNKGSAID